MSVFDRDWFYKSTSDDFTSRISKYFDSFKKKEKQMFEERWNPFFGQNLKWNPPDGFEIKVELVSKKEVDELKSQVKVLEENYNKLLDRITKENIPEMEAPKFSFDKTEGNVVTFTSSQEEDVKKLLDQMKKLCIGSEIDTAPIQEDDEAKFEAQLKDLDPKTLEETFPQNPPDARSRTINHKAYHTLEEKLPPIEISIPEGATLSCRSEPEREIKFTYHKNHEWISCENALPKEGVAVELKRVNHEGIEQIQESIRTKICQKIAFESKAGSGSLYFYPHLDKTLYWRPLPQDSLLDVLEIDENDEDYKNLKGQKGVIETRKNRIEDANKRIEVAEKDIAYFESKLKEKTLNPSIKKEREVFYKKMKTTMDIAKKTYEKFTSGMNELSEETISILRDKLPIGVKIEKVNSLEDLDKMSGSPESKHFSFSIYRYESDLKQVQYSIFYDPNSIEDELKKCFIESFKSGVANEGKEFELNIGDQVIGLSPRDGVILGKIKNIEENTDIFGQETLVPICLIIEAKEQPYNYWLDARRTVKLTPELKAEINKILA